VKIFLQLLSLNQTSMFSIHHLFIYLMAMTLLVKEGCTLQALEQQKRTARAGFNLYFMDFKNKNRIFRKPKTWAKYLIILCEKSIFEPEVVLLCLKCVWPLPLTKSSLRFMGIISLYSSFTLKFSPHFLTIRSAIFYLMKTL